MVRLDRYWSQLIRTALCACTVLGISTAFAREASADYTWYKYRSSAFRTMFDWEVDSAGWNYAYIPDLTPGNPNAANNSTLVLFLPGTGSSTASYERFMIEAVKQGYWVLGLDYVNDQTVTDLCTCNETCYARYFEQTVDGADHGFYRKYYLNDTATPLRTAYNSVSQRFGDFAFYLQDVTGFNFRQFWYSPEGRPYWPKIIAAGHSQGGVLATWIAKNKNVSRAIAMSAPASYLNIANDQQSNSPDGPSYVADTSNAKLNTCVPRNEAPSLISVTPRSTWNTKLRIIGSVDDSAWDGTKAGKNLRADITKLGLSPHLVTGCNGTDSHPVVVLDRKAYATSCPASGCTSNAHNATAGDQAPTFMECIWRNMLTN